MMEILDEAHDKTKSVQPVWSSLSDGLFGVERFHLKSPSIGKTNVNMFAILNLNKSAIPQ